MTLKNFFYNIKKNYLKLKDFLQKNVKNKKIKLFQKFNYLKFKIWLKDFTFFVSAYVIYLKCLTLISLFLFMLLNYFSNYYFITNEEIKSICSLLESSFRSEIILENNLMSDIKSTDKKEKSLINSSKVVSDLSDFGWTIPYWDLIHRPRIANPNVELLKELVFKLETERIERELKSAKFNAVCEELERTYMHIRNYHINRFANNEPYYPHGCPMLGLPPFYLFHRLINRSIIIACDTKYREATGQILTEEIFDGLSVADQTQYYLASLNLFGILDLV